MLKTTIYLPEVTERRMRQAARLLGKSRAELTREALDAYLDRCEGERGLPASVGMGDNPDARAATYEGRLAGRFGGRVLTFDDRDFAPVARAGSIALVPADREARRHRRRHGARSTCT